MINLENETTHLITVSSNNASIKDALSPLSDIVWDYKKIESSFMPELAQKLDEIPKERIITPDLTIAGPAVEAIRFAGHNPNLRKLYANLLATSIDSETAHKVHPAFVEILKQITPDEAKLLKFFSTQSVLPIIDVVAKTKDLSGSIRRLKNYSHFGNLASCSFNDLVVTYLDNLSRLELIKIYSDKAYVNDELYKDLDNDPFILKYIEEGNANNPDFTYSIEHESIDITNLGKQFISACIS